MGRLALTGMAAPVERGRGAWTRVSISGIEDLADAVYGAGLAATQMSRAPLHGSLAFAERDSVLYSSGSIDGRVALRGPLSESRRPLAHSASIDHSIVAQFGVVARALQICNLAARQATTCARAT